MSVLQGMEIHMGNEVMKLVTDNSAKYAVDNLIEQGFKQYKSAGDPYQTYKTQKVLNEKYGISIDINNVDSNRDEWKKLMRYPLGIEIAIDLSKFNGEFYVWSDGNKTSLEDFLQIVKFTTMNAEPVLRIRGGEHRFVPEYSTKRYRVNSFVNIKQMEIFQCPEAMDKKTNKKMLYIFLELFD